MASRLFPKQIDNDYRGGRLAIWLTVPVLLWKLAIGFHLAGFAPYVSNRYVLMAADGIPLDSYGAEAASWIVYLAASWGVASFLLCALCVLALLRYRAMLPLCVLLLALEQIGRKAVVTMQPIVRAEAADAPGFGFYLNWAFTIALVAAFAISLVERRR